MSDSRLEKFIYAICSMDVSDLSVPLSRIEKLWNCLITGETPDFEPLSRNEKYLMAMLDRYDISNLPAPMSRGEKLLYKIAVGETDLSDVPGYLSRYEELLKYLIENGGIGFEYVLHTLNQSLSTLYNTAEKPVKSAILKGSTKYRDIDTGEFLETFEEGRNLELVSVKMPVLNTTGKNLFDGKMEIGSIDNKGEVYVNVNHKRCVNFIPIKENTTYTISKEKADDGYILVHEYDENKNFIKYDVVGVYQKGIFTTDSNTRFVKFRYEKVADNNIQIEEGSVATSYEPFKSNILTVNEDVTLRGISDVRDELNVVTGEVTKRFEEINLSELQTGLYTQDAMATDCYSFYYNPQICKPNGKVLDNDLPTISRSNEGEGVYISSTGRINLNIKSHKMTDSSLNSFMNYLTNNPTIIQYELPTESIKTVDLTTLDQDGQPTKLKTFNNITYVEMSADNIIPSVDIEVATKINETLASLDPQQLDISNTQNELGQTVDEQSENTDATMMATTEIYEQTL